MKLDSVVKAVEQFDLLDGVASSLAKAVGKAVSPRPVRNLLSGTYIGHPLHPVLTDLPIGAWSMAALLDLAGGRASEPAADALVVVGIATAVPTAAAGLNDWSDTTGKTRRTGVVHALANSAALCLYVSSAIARRSGRRGLGKTLGLAGFGLMSAGGFLGGHLTYADAVNVNKTAERTGPSKWTAVLDADGMSDGDRAPWRSAGSPSCCTGPRERSTHSTPCAATWAAPWRRGRLRTAASFVRGTAAPSGWPTGRSSADRPPAPARLRNADKRRPDRGPPGRLRQPARPPRFSRRGRGRPCHHPVRASCGARPYRHPSQASCGARPCHRPSQASCGARPCRPRAGGKVRAWRTPGTAGQSGPPARGTPSSSAVELRFPRGWKRPACC